MRKYVSLKILRSIYFATTAIYSGLSELLVYKMNYYNHEFSTKKFPYQSLTKRKLHFKVLRYVFNTLNLLRKYFICQEIFEYFITIGF